MHAFDQGSAPSGLYSEREADIALVSAAKASVLDVPLVCSLESLRFLGRRYQAQAEHCQKLLECRSAPELVSEQLRFLVETASDYAGEPAVIMQEAQSTLLADPLALAG